MLESSYQGRLIRKLKRMFPDAFILKNDADYIQGIPDLLILVGQKWAMLEVKQSSRSIIQPNQTFYVAQLNQMSFAAFIYPEIEEEVLNALQQALEPDRPTRASRRKQVQLD